MTLPANAWSTPECQVEVVWGTLENSIRAFLKAEKIEFEEGAGARSSGAGNSCYFCMAADNAAKVRKFFWARLQDQRERFDLKDYE